MRRRRAPKRKIIPDARFNNIIIARFINRLMNDGKKSVVEKSVYDAFDMIEKKLGKSLIDLFENYDSIFVGSDNKKLGGMFDFLGTKKKEKVKEMSKEEKLIELRDLFNKKLITKKVYEEKMKELLRDGRKINNGLRLIRSVYDQFQ